MRKYALMADPSEDFPVIGELQLTFMKNFHEPFEKLVVYSYYKESDNLGELYKDALQLSKEMKKNNDKRFIYITDITNKDTNDSVVIMRFDVIESVALKEIKLNK